MAAKKKQKETKPSSPEEAKEPRVYEVGFLFVSAISEDKAMEEADAIRRDIDDLGGNRITEATPKFIELAYTMELSAESKRSKYTHAYFGWIKFEAGPEAVAELDERLQARKGILRFLISKTVKENTFSSHKLQRKPAAADSRRPSKPAAGAPQARKPISAAEEAEIDKSIEELVTE